jgi:hypothetical protein
LSKGYTTKKYSIKVLLLSIIVISNKKRAVWQLAWIHFPCANYFELEKFKVASNTRERKNIESMTELLSNGLK